ncbi:Ectonucleoside triphosphate diphosphohydrolase 5 [Lamellibrachia satsuma]|nr:Ectonucleoside triphosphate diphosphohydrolase 5 [Lamellibrachia satsuma]
MVHKESNSVETAPPDVNLCVSCPTILQMFISRAPSVHCCPIIYRRCVSMGLNQPSTWTQGQRSSVIMVIVVMGILLILSSYNGLLSNPLHRPFFVGTSHQYLYGIIFDAGSTGSRIHVFKFQPAKPGKPHKLVDDLFIQVKPGLSAYKKDPKKAADSLIDMLDRAKLYIPPSHWKTTPMALKATAGLRALPGKAANDILAEVYQLFLKYPFKTNKDSVQIMEGNDEGIFSWVTVNFLTEHTEQSTSRSILVSIFEGDLGSSDRMLGVLDLGGGSTQISFIPKHNSTLTSTPSEFFTKLNLFGKSFQLYTHSYFGLGLMSGRLQTLGGDLDPGKASELSNDCLPSSAKGSWTQNGGTYSLKGKTVKGDRFDMCYSHAKKVVEAGHVNQPAEVKDKTFCLISYYFDRAVESKLIDSEKGGTLTVADFIGAARKACAEDQVEESRQFMCVDLTYICALLQDGFGFNKDTRLELKKMIHGTEISWALGAMFNLLDQPNSDPASGG